MKYIKLLIIIVSLILVTGCNRSSDYDGVLNVLNWSSYIPDSVIHDFEEEYNIKVNYGTYSSNEELLAKVTSSKEGTYDLVFPSDYMVELMKEKNIIMKLDKDKILNYYNIDDTFLHQSYDPYNEYSLPFLSTVVVIAVNEANITDNITGYNDLLMSKYKNNIVILDDQRIVIGMSLMALGYDMNETDPKALKEAEEWLIKLKQNIKAYDSDSPKTFFITDEVDIGIMWSAEAILARDENPNINIIYPSEGHAISMDNYVILKGSKNVDNAYLFIDYLLRDDVSKKIIAEYPYISPNKSIYNTISLDDIFNKGYYVENIGSNIKEYDKLWADIK
ncbi:MAG: spermidine/putrescine ABC transporter substrate-binding protein [Bacilli bacterium]|nr:spermidine/putrescine ABC transporter substrate-binding protein [Bacilli bacterium]